MQLDLMLVSTKELTEENSRIRERDREMKLTVQLHEKEKKMALNKSEMQSKVSNNATGPLMQKIFETF